ETFRRRLFRDTGRLNQKHERASAAVHDRHFTGSEIDVRVVDAKAGKSRHQVFNGGNAHTFAFNCCRKASVCDIFGTSTNLDRLWQIDASKYDSRVGRSG